MPYVTKAWCGDESADQDWTRHPINDAADMTRTRTVVDDDAVPQFSGLLNARGEKLYRVPARVTCGFHRR